MRQYESYQNSNVDWLPIIPSTWSAKRIKNLFSLHDERNYKPLEEVNLISLYTSIGVRQHSDIEHTTGNKARNADGYKIVNVDDIIVNIMLCWMGAIGRSAYSGVTSPAYDVYTPHDGVNSSYYHYLFRTPLFSQQCFRNGHGIMMMRWRTYSPEFCSIVVPVPPHEEQNQIVRFLDWKVSEINRLINIKRKEIERLEELKKAVVSSRLSGEKIWLKRLLLTPLQYGANSSGTVFNSKLPRYVRITDIDSKGQLKNEGVKSIDTVEAAPYILKNGDVLLARSGATVGKAFMYKPEHGLCAFAGYLIRAKLNTNIILPEYFLYFTESLDYSNWKDGVFIQATIQNISAERYNKLPVPVPSIEEQQQIVTYLDEQTKKINTAIANKQQQLQTMQELKNRLISDVVTGKIDVRGVEIPEYKYISEETDEMMNGKIDNTEEEFDEE